MTQDMKAFFREHPDVLALVRFDDKPDEVWPITEQSRHTDNFVAQAIAHHESMGERALIYYDTGVTVGIPFLDVRRN